MAILGKYFYKNTAEATRVRQRRTIAFVSSLIAALALLLSLQTRAEHTRHWRQASFEDFSRGTAKGVALRSDGRLELAPHFADFADADCAYLWALRLDTKGNLYAAGGSNAKVLRVDPAGKANKVFEAAELSAQAIALDARDNLYVGTSPDGKVYKITPSGEKAVFFEPKTKYIWDLLIDRSGTLYVATGDKGQIFAVAPDGKSEIFYSGDETHIRALALDTKGNLIAGTEPNGLILRVPAGHSAPTKNAQPGTPRKAFVLYESSKKEITAIVADVAGNIYAAAIGEKQKIAGAISPPFTFQPPISTTNTAGGVMITNQSIQQPTIFTPFPAAVSSAVFHVAPDGAPEEIWSSRDSLVYSLGLSPRGKLLLGTGNDGSVLEIEGPGVFASLAKPGSAQITAFAQASNGKTYLTAANPGKIFILGPDFEAQGSFESQTFDARMFSDWGRLEWFGDGPRANSSTNGASPNDASTAFYVRSGNTSDPGKDWSPWAGPYTASGLKVECPPARFIQWKAQVKAQPNGQSASESPGQSKGSDGSSRSRSSDASPTKDHDAIHWVSIAYLPKNVPPAIDAIVLQNPGVRIQNPSSNPSSISPSVQVKMPPQTSTLSGISITSSSAQSDRPAPKFEPAPQGTQQRGFQSVVWSAHDDNEDDLAYSIYYRGEGERDWKLLKDKIEQKYFSWDTSSLPDGAYYLKIVASDAPSNPPSEALKAERESERFEIDNTPPVIEALSAKPSSDRNDSPKGATRIHFEARDSSSAIARAEYSVDGADWMLVPPVGRLSDAPHETYDFAISGLGAGEHTVAVRVFDRFENAASGKTTFRTPPSRP